ncbi:MAG: GTPase HflX [Deltaproteobacteria bacterium]|nr:GTPase HflX [Deltaproteobacteria bacterium]
MEELFGNKEGLKPSQNKALQSLYHRRLPADRWLSPEFARRMTEISRDTGRQVGVLVDRLGVVDKVIVGDAHQLFIPDLGRERAGGGRFRGVRLLHTHLRGEGLSKDDLTDLALLRLDGVVVVQARPDGLPGAAEYAHLLPPGGGDVWKLEPVDSIHLWDDDFTAFIKGLEAQFRPSTRAVDARDAAVCISVTTAHPQGAKRSLEELARLADTAGLRVVDSVLQVRRELDGRTLVGQGKLKDLVVRCMHNGAEHLIFDQELSPSQLRNIATETDLKVLDRTQLILDIFAQRATTREGKLQVELAQLRYRRPRLALMPTAMSRLTGGIGGRGPGETKLEINRRRADEREHRIERQLRDIADQRAMRRDRRKRVGLPLVAIVGYTNAGKSTLLNRMTNAAVDAEDKLFATLDPTSRRLRFPAEREIVLTDTVGFIRNLPSDLVHAFRSTLDESVEADLLLLVVNAADDEAPFHKATVEKTLEELGAGEVPRLVVLNQVDRADPERLAALARDWDASCASAVTGEGTTELLHRIERAIFRERAASAHALKSAPAALAPDADSVS